MNVKNLDWTGMDSFDWTGLKRAAENKSVLDWTVLVLTE